MLHEVAPDEGLPERDRNRGADAAARRRVHRPVLDEALRDAVEERVGVVVEREEVRRGARPFIIPQEGVEPQVRHGGRPIHHIHDGHIHHIGVVPAFHCI